MLSKIKMARIDKAKKPIHVGDWVRLPRSPGKYPVHGEWLRTFNRFSGRVLRVVGWDTQGYAHLDIGPELLSVEPYLLKVIRSGRKHR